MLSYTAEIPAPLRLELLGLAAGSALVLIGLFAALMP